MPKKEIVLYKTPAGRCPYEVWLKKLKDWPTVARIQKRVNDAAYGYYGDYKMLGSGLLELRIHFGKGYRVYMAELDGVYLLLLCGGTKNTKKEQQDDIAAARTNLEEFLTR